MKEQFFKCSCSSEILRVSYDEEFGIADFSIYTMLSRQPTFWQRLRWCWKILIEGSPYGDQVIFEKEGVANLVNYLVKIQNHE